MPRSHTTVQKSGFGIMGQMRSMPFKVDLLKQTTESQHNVTLRRVRLRSNHSEDAQERVCIVQICGFGDFIPATYHAVPPSPRQSNFRRATNIRTPKKSQREAP